MANGDIAAAAGIPKVDATDDRRLGYDEINRALDLIVTTRAALLAGDGLVPIIPASVAGPGITMDAAGRITITNGTTAFSSVNGCFTPAFANYRLIIRVLNRSAITDLQLRLRAAGTDHAGTYSSQRGWNYGPSGAAPVSNQKLSDTSWPIDAEGVAPALSTLDIVGPRLAEGTMATGTFSMAGAAMGAGHIGLFHNQNTGYDGLSLAAAAAGATYSLRLRIFGYN